MKIQFNITTDSYDLDRYSSQEDFISMLDGFDGVELLYCGEDSRNIIPIEKVVGLHMSFPQYWLDFWNGNISRCIEEFGSEEAVYTYYGGCSRQALIDSFCKNLEIAWRYKVEYMVFHVSNASSAETLSNRYVHSDEEVIEAACELINSALPIDTDGPTLLFENLWQSGLTFTRPEITERLLKGIRYPRKGIMLDTGHLMHTNLLLKSQTEALAYIHRCLDAHGELCKSIRGIHLNQSLTGDYMRQVKKNPPLLSENYNERMDQLYDYIFQVDRHQPFSGVGVRELIDRIAPEYLTYEFISKDRKELEKMIFIQRKALSE